MKVFLTGASGFLGRYVLEELIRRGIPVVTIGRQRNIDSDLVSHVQVDMLIEKDFSDLIIKTEVTHLLHLAWYAEHGKFWDSSLNLRWVDVTTRLVETCCKLGVKKIVIAGTCAEYDWSYGYCTEENTPINPQTLYGVAKDATRRLAMSVCEQYQTPCSWGRIFLPYGNGEQPQRLIPSLIAVLQDKRIPFGVNKLAFRDFLHVYDVAEGFISLLLSDEKGTFNVSSGNPVQITEIVNKIAKLLNADPKKILSLATERPNEPNMLVGDNSKLKSLGWNVKYTLDSGLEEIVKSSV